jgi:tripartite-type tricarboxylate transporter receptor subunit TctC
VVNPKVPAKSVKELIALAKSEPGKLTYGSSGVGGTSHLSGALFCSLANIQMTHVPYCGGEPAMADVISGQMELMIGNLPGPYPQIVAGKLRGLAVTSGQRSSRVPDIPTVAEQGVPGFDVSSWYGICTQAGVPKPVFDKLRADLLKALGSADVKKRLTEQGVDPKTSTPEEFVEHVKKESARWARVVREAKIPPE